MSDSCESKLSDTLCCGYHGVGRVGWLWLQDRYQGGVGNGAAELRIHVGKSVEFRPLQGGKDGGRINEWGKSL
jgi:hypothetical protein